MTITSLGFFLGIIVPISQTQQIGISHTAKLYSHLFESGLYHPEIRPKRNESEPIKVSVHLWFKQVLKVDEVDQILTVYCWLEEYWKDENLQWEPGDFGGVKVLHIPAKKLWRPDILVYNNANMNIKDNELETNALLYHNGSIALFRAVITDIACNLDMTYFPFDQQVCFIMFASWSYDGSKLLLEPITGSASNLQFYIENTEWTLLDFKFKSNLKYYECCDQPFPDIVYYFSMERNPSYYILSLIIPSAFITVVTIIGFFIPHSSSGENTEKVSLGVTALLSLAIILLMVADKMPATSKVTPLIGKYYIGLIFVIFIAACTTTITLYIQIKGNAGKPLSPEMRNLFFEKLAKYFFIKVDIPLVMDHIPQNHASETTFLLQSQSRYGVNEESADQWPANWRHSLDPTPTDLRPGCNRNKGQHGTPNLSEAILEQISDTTAEILGELRARTRKDMIRKEWAQLARVIDRIFLVFFVGITVLFALAMLKSRGKPVVLTEELMSSPND